MTNKISINELKAMIENNIYKTGHDGTRYYLLNRDELEGIIELLEKY